MQNITNKSNNANKTALGGQPSSQQHRFETPLSQAENAARSLARFINPAELQVLSDCCRGEEGNFWRARIVELAELVGSMPTTYETDGLGDQAVAYLHYFTSDCDWYVTERDQSEEQHQAFGLSCIWEQELGYISIQELIEAGAELDLYWTPKSIGHVKAERLMADVNYPGHPMHY